MEALIGIGRDLLQKPVARVNIDTGVYEPVPPVARCDGEGRTAPAANEEALGRFAEVLSMELRLRKRNFNSY